MALLHTNIGERQGGVSGFLLPYGGVEVLADVLSAGRPSAMGRENLEGGEGEAKITLSRRSGKGVKVMVPVVSNTLKTTVIMQQSTVDNFFEVGVRGGGWGELTIVSHSSLVPPGPLFICVFRGPGTRSHVTLDTT